MAAWLIKYTDMGFESSISSIKTCFSEIKRLMFFMFAGVTTNSVTATNCVSLYDLRGIH